MFPSTWEDTKGVEVWTSPRVDLEQGPGCLQVAQGRPSHLLAGETVGNLLPGSSEMLAMASGSLRQSGRPSHSKWM